MPPPANLLTPESGRLGMRYLWVTSSLEALIMAIVGGALIGVLGLPADGVNRPPECAQSCNVAS